MNNKSSLCYLTYGQGGNYTYFIAYPDRKKQNSKMRLLMLRELLVLCFWGSACFLSAEQSLGTYLYLPKKY